MEFKDYVCDKLKDLGEVKAKKMFGTYNINVNNINLGLLCDNKWYLKKTQAGDAFLSAKGIELPIGTKANSYIVSDFSDEKTIRELARITYEELAKQR
ncbi:MAG: TfoX/Sxy family protein [Eubacteriales bacterium]